MRKSPLQQLVQERTGRDLEELLRELYVGQRRSDREIAESLKVDRATVQQWRAQFGIGRDDREQLEPLVPVS